MANVRTILSLLAFTPSATSTDANYPVANLSDIVHGLRPYRAALSGAIVDITLDWGSGHTLSGLAADPAIFLNALNVTSVRIQGNSTPSWSSPPWDQPVTISKDREVGRYKGFWRLADLTAAAHAYRYTNIRIPAQSTVDGGNYSIAGICVGQMAEWSRNPNYGAERTRTDRARTVELLGGGVEVARLGDPAMVLRYPRVFSSLTSLNEQLDLLDLGLDQPCVIWDATLGNGSQDAYLVRRTEAMPLKRDYIQYDSGQLVLREVT